MDATVQMEFQLQGKSLGSVSEVPLFIRIRAGCSGRIESSSGASSQVKSR